MLNNEAISMETENPGICTSKQRKLYTKPHLEEIGDLRTVTLGPSPGQYESGPGDLTHKNDLGF